MTRELFLATKGIEYLMCCFIGKLTDDDQEIVKRISKDDCSLFYLDHSFNPAFTVLKFNLCPSCAGHSTRSDAVFNHCGKTVQESEYGLDRALLDEILMEV